MSAGVKVSFSKVENLTLIQTYSEHLLKICLIPFMSHQQVKLKENYKVQLDTDSEKMLDLDCWVKYETGSCPVRRSL